jgi:hypothetical protein
VKKQIREKNKKTFVTELLQTSDQKFCAKTQKFCRPNATEKLK